MKVSSTATILLILAGILGWSSLLSFILAIYFLVMAFLGAGWKIFFILVLLSVFLKWLAYGIKDNAERNIIEERLVSLGFSTHESASIWIKFYSLGCQERLLALSVDEIRNTRENKAE